MTNNLYPDVNGILLFYIIPKGVFIDVTELEVSLIDKVYIVVKTLRYILFLVGVCKTFCNKNRSHIGGL